MEFLSTAGTKITSVKCAVLFDPEDGSIKHTHHIITLEGGKETAEDQMDKKVIALAEEIGLDTGKLKLMYVDNGAFEPGFRYTVDPEKKILIKKQRTLR